MARHLAQMNVAQARWPADDPRMAEFHAQVSAINTVAEASPGFVWRLTDDAGEPRMLVNLSVWESQDALRAFVYKSEHAGVLRDRARWFEETEQANQVWWWIPAGHRPSYAEGWAKLEHLRTNGQTSEAFTLSYPASSISSSSISTSMDA